MRPQLTDKTQAASVVTTKTAVKDFSTNTMHTISAQSISRQILATPPPSGGILRNKKQGLLNVVKNCVKHVSKLTRRTQRGKKKRTKSIHKNHDIRYFARKLNIPTQVTMKNMERESVRDRVRKTSGRDLKNDR